MPLTSFQKHYIKKNLEKLSLEQITQDLNLPQNEISKYIKKHWPKEKYEKLSGQNKFSGYPPKIGNFDWQNFIADNINVFLLLFILIFIVYFNSLNNAFVSDDISGIVTNPNIGKFSAVFVPFYGFLHKLTFFIIYKLAGATPIYFRLSNFLFHLGSTFVIFIIFSFLYKKPVAIATALLFAIHPIMTETVSWISGVSYAEYGFFFLLSFLFYILSKSQENSKKLLYFSVIAFILSLLANEKAMSLFLVFIVFELAFGQFEMNWKKIIPFFVVSVLWALIFASKLAFRIGSVESISYAPTQGPALTNPFFQIPIAIGTYLKLIFWPDKLSLYQTEMSFSTGQYLIFLAIFVIFISAIFYGWKKNKIIFFWLMFFIITLLPTLTPLKIAWIVAERYVYLGSLGIFVVVAMLFDWLMEKIKYGEEKYKFAIYGLFAIVILALSTRTIVRNTDWQNEDTLWIATAKTSPSGPNIHNNLGDVYGRQGNLEKAVEEFQKAIEINPRYADAYHNLGNTYRDMRKLDLAIASYQKALEFNPNLWQSYQNLAASYFELGDFLKAQEFMKKALEIDPHNKNLQDGLQVIQAKLK